MRKILFIVGLMVSVGVTGQAPGIKWSHCYGDTLDNWLLSTIITNDSCFISVGSGDSIKGYTQIVGYITKVDKQGNLVWAKKQLLYDNFIYKSILQTSTGELFASGYTATIFFGTGFCKLNSVGDTIFTKYFNNYDANTIKETSKGDIIAVGSSYNAVGDLDLGVMLLSKNGTIKWRKDFGGTRQDEAYNVIELQDGSFTIYGKTLSNDGDVVGFHDSITNSTDAWIINIDSAGNKRWQKCIGGSVVDFFVDLIHNYDNTYWGLISTNSFDGDIVGNHGMPDSILPNNPNDIMIVKLDSVGNILKKKCFGGSWYEWGASLIKDKDSNLVILAYTNKGIDGDHLGLIFDTIKTYAWLFKVDTNLNILWNKHFGGVDKVNNMRVSKLLRDIEGNYIVNGTVSSNGDDINDWHSSYSCNYPWGGCTPREDFWQVKLGYDGVILPLKLLSFTAQKENNSVLLNWQTANEVNVSHINVQRSVNNKDFIDIGKVNASCCAYSFVDGQQSTFDRQLYYRLEIVDKDGSKTYSTIQQITIKPQTPNILIFPNPTKEQVTITCKNAKEILVIDYLGRTVHQSMVNGQWTIVNTNQFSKGIYVVKAMMNNGEIKTEKLMVE